MTLDKNLLLLGRNLILITSTLNANDNSNDENHADWNTTP